MPCKGTLRSFRLVLATTAAALALSPCVRAGGYKCNCEPYSAVYQSPFFGYYRTCWRHWPGGQPPCPCSGTPQAAEPTPPATKERAIELLPPPRPEPGEPEKK
jgi:hypothetical protein